MINPNDKSLSPIYTIRSRQNGFTLIEMLLVLVIVSSFIYMGMTYFQQQTVSSRINRAAAQVQQILSAGASYYLANGQWPSSLDCLLGNGGSGCVGNVPYLATSQMKTPWAGQYSVVSITTTGASAAKPGLLYVYFTVPSMSTTTAPGIANTIAGKLPIAYTSNLSNGLNGGLPSNAGVCTEASCYVVSSINVPGMSLNTANAVNFANIYHSGSCVPVPNCPIDANGNQMEPQIIGVPVSLAGFNQKPTNTGTTGTTNCNDSDVSDCQGNVFPIASYTVWATGPSNYGSWPANCVEAGSAAQCWASQAGSPMTALTDKATQKYWRICLEIKTDQGTVVLPSGTVSGTTVWGKAIGAIMVITRCAPKNEKTGSDFTVWSG